MMHPENEIEDYIPARPQVPVVLDVTCCLVIIGCCLWAGWLLVKGTP